MRRSFPAVWGAVPGLAQSLHPPPEETEPEDRDWPKVLDAAQLQKAALWPPGRPSPARGGRKEPEIPSCWQGRRAGSSCPGPCGCVSVEATSPLSASRASPCLSAR